MLLPHSIAFVSSETDLFSDLVQSGEERAQVTLPIHLRGYLVHCFIEYLSDPAIVSRVLALDFLDPARRTPGEQAVFLKRSGDASLILAGLFPTRARRLNVSSEYFRTMGQSFFGMLATYLTDTGERERGRLYNEVAQQFPTLERVLGATRTTDSEWDAYQRFRLKLN